MTQDIILQEQSECGVLKVRQYHGPAARDTIRQMNSPSGLLICGSVKSNLEEQGFQFDVARDNKSIYTPQGLWKGLAKYTKVPKFNPVGQALDQAIALAKQSFGRKSGTVEPLKLDEGLLKAIKQSKSSGAPSFTSKGEAFPVDLERAKRIQAGSRAFDPCVGYHRVQHGESGPKVRLVWGYPLSATLLEAMFARPLISYFIGEDTSHPMAFGRRRFEIAAMTQAISNSGLKVGLDYSGFDSSIHPRLIDHAFDILKSHFDLDDVQEQTWDKIVWYFIHTTILMPDGYVYKKHQGVPSGSYFTQMVDSIVNFISVQYIAIRLTGQAIPSGRLFVLGDDSIFSAKEHVPIHRYKQLAAELGLVINTEKSEVSNTRQFKFLGHVWDRGLVHRDASDIAKRLVFPEKFNGDLSPQQFVATRMFASIADSIEGWQIYNHWVKAKGRSVHARCVREDVALDEPVFGFQVMQKELGLTPWYVHSRGVGSVRLAYLGLLL